jgi:hypothetical protein
MGEAKRSQQRDATDTPAVPETAAPDPFSIAVGQGVDGHVVIKFDRAVTALALTRAEALDFAQKIIDKAQMQ